MLRRIGLMAGVLVLAGVLMGQAPSPEKAPDKGKAKDAGQSRQQQMMDRIRQNLNATDAEWKALEPKVQKVQTLQTDLRSGIGRIGGRGGQAAEEPTTDLGKKTSALQKLVADTAAKPEAIKEALAAYRTARDKARADLTAAQKDLRGGVNVQQEAALVLLGMLE